MPAAVSSKKPDRLPPAILLLAAGASTRLGRPKQLLAYQGKTLLRRAAETAVAAADGSPVLVVTGAIHAPLLPELLNLPVHVHHCPEWAAGMGASLKAGLHCLEAMHPLVAGVTVMLCDQPHVTPDLLHQLGRAAAQNSRPMAAAEYAGVLGAPAFFSQAVLGFLRQIADRAGAGQLLRQHRERVVPVPFPAGLLDVDTEEQYAALLSQPPE
ncbi:nucleotidyltransferase family protein [Hymenobacter sp. BT18]|uniref:nucleotidyltransferase family protein n=1 Tax=Hymenobacter sp. BT18 TaxID=2835648 RepID=UPI00143E6F50|nr:nucleotidyltransferase family protein [Hymenobacter sp. BT18]QIX62943.1 nucleotidyltransferase family protein [Hymenobacter sp. BT18]